MGTVSTELLDFLTFRNWLAIKRNMRGETWQFYIAWPKNTPADGMHKYLISASQLTAVKQAFTNVQKLNQSASKVWHFTIALGHHSRGMIACSTGVFIGRARMVLIAKAPCWNSRREEEMGRVKGKGEGAGRKKRNIFSPLPLPPRLFLPSHLL